MSNEDVLETAMNTPVGELDLGDVRLRRAIKKSGFETLAELFAASEKEIDSLFSPEDADSIFNLKDRYQANPLKFVESVRKVSNAQAVQREQLARKAQPAVRAGRCERERDKSRDIRPHAQAHATCSRSNSLIPKTPSMGKLLDCENRASRVFEELNDRYQDVMVYQAFSEFSTELDDINEAFESLFSHYSSRPKEALRLVDRYLRNVFVVFVADRARSSYNEGNLWGNFFDGLSMKSGIAQHDFKQMFVDHIERLGMPLYARNEESHFYFYTALLHGGLSADSWANLWQKSLLPLVKEIFDGDFCLYAELDGHAVLKELKNPESRFAPKKTVLSILEKAPDSTIAPLFEASIRVAEQLQGSYKTNAGYTMLSSYGLPDAAMQALRENQEKKASAVAAGKKYAKNGNGGASRLVYLPMASLRLDLASGEVLMMWPRQQFPLHFADHRIDYCIDGKCVASKPFELSVGKCILESVELSVSPQPRYDVEIKLMKRRDGSDDYEEESSLRQSFAKSKPGCFEFVGDSNGVYRLREPNERISRRRRIAYLVKSGYSIQPGSGMAPVYEFDASSEWDSAQIFVFDVDPGASGAVIESSTGREIAVWQERYKARIDKRRIIGETEEGLDLYGYVPNWLGTNGGLPTVTMEVMDGLKALEDLEIVCICDGARVSVPRRILWADELGDSSAALIALVLQDSALFGTHIETCEITARQKSSGDKVVFKYRFAVIPIQDFRLKGVSFDYGVAVADYGFQAVHAIDVTSSQGDMVHVNAWGRYSAKALLEDEFLHVRISSVLDGRETRAKLALAAIEIDVPKALADVAQDRAICLADALDIGPSGGNFKIRSIGWRYNRAVVAMLGCVPLLLEELKGPSEVCFNLFRRPACFLQADNTAPSDCPLSLSIIYGDDVSSGRLRPAWTDVPLINCREGVGFSSWSLYAKSDGSHVLKFDAPALCGLHFEFLRKVGNRVIAEAEVEEGGIEVVIPSPVMRCLDARKKILVAFSPVDWFGEPECEYSVEFSLER